MMSNSGKPIVWICLIVFMSLALTILAGVNTAHAQDECPDGICPPTELPEKKKPTIVYPSFTPTVTVTPTFTKTAPPLPTRTLTPTNTFTPFPTITVTPASTAGGGSSDPIIAWVQDKLPWFPNWPNTGDPLADELLTYPYLILVGLGLVIVFVGWYIWKGQTWEDFWAWLKNVAPYVAAVFTAKFWDDVWKKIKEGWNWMWNTSMDQWKEWGMWLYDNIWTPVSNWATGAYNSTVNWFTGAGNTVSNTATSTVNTVSNTAQNTANTISNTAQNTANTVANTTTNAANTVANTAEKAVNKVGDTAKDAGKSVEKGTKKAGKAIKKLFKK